MLYEGYKQSAIKEIPKAHQLMKWLRENIPKDDKKPGMEWYTFIVVWQMQSNSNSIDTVHYTTDLNPRTYKLT